MKTSTLPAVLALSMIIVSCGKKPNKDANIQSQSDTVPEASKTPELPKPSKSHILFSKVIGWPEGKTPVAPAGFAVTKFAGELDNPRQIYVAPNGDVFVSMANTEASGLKKVENAVIGKAKSQNNKKSANQVLLFKRGDPTLKSVFLEHLNRPFGMLVLNNYFYVANTDGLWRYPYNGDELSLTVKGEKILALPAGGYNNHWTRNLLASKDGSKIYVSVGSGSNVAEHGIKNEIRRANILEINPDGSSERVFAHGLRNPVGMGWAPGTNVLWAAVNERDELGDELVPDYLTSVKEGAFYGWPYSYFGQNVEPRIKPADQKPALVSAALVPDVRLESHSASLGLTFYDGKTFAAKYRDGAFVGQHGSWNRSVLTGYRVLFVPFKNGRPSGPPEDFLTGFISGKDSTEVYGRPVGVAITKDGALLVADDASNIIWKVAPTRR